ncbi:unnamed protein product [Rotaria sp. Silwood1]|nr:unnamed protein product [Rotaria sp. Silwood1]
MENEIDADELAAILAEDEQEQEESKSKLLFSEQAETMTSEQLVELTCSLIDKPITTKKSSTDKFSNIDMNDLFENKTSKYENLHTNCMTLFI